MFSNTFLLDKRRWTALMIVVLLLGKGEEFDEYDADAVLILAHRNRYRALEPNALRSYETLFMSKKRAQRKNDPREEMALKKAKARREALWSYVLIAIVLGLILYGLYIQILHHS